MSKAPLKLQPVTSCLSSHILASTTSTQNGCLSLQQFICCGPISDSLILVLVFHPPPAPFVKLFASALFASALDRFTPIIMASMTEPTAAAAIQVCVYCHRVCASGLFEAPSRGWAELFYSQLTALRLAAAHLRRDHRPPCLSGNRRPE